MIDGSVQGWRFRNPDQAVDAEMQEWVRLAFGETAAALPSELRESLYSEVQMWGPAVEEVFAFLVELDAALSAGSDEGKALQDALMVLPEGVTAGGVVLGVDGVAGMLLTSRLEWFLELMCFALQDKRIWELYQGVTVVLWVLNGAYMFTAAEAAGEGRLVRMVNGILDGLGLPALQGSFAGVGS